MNAAVASTILAFDYGTRKVGVAIGNTVSGEARPLTTIQYVANQTLFDAVSALLTEWAPGRLVVGRPLLDDGGPCEMTASSDRFARRLAGRTGLPVDRVDERYSSVAAGSALLEAHERSLPRGRRRPRRLPESEDATAAAIILRQYLAGGADACADHQSSGESFSP